MLSTQENWTNEFLKTVFESNSIQASQWISNDLIRNQFNGSFN